MLLVFMLVSYNCNLASAFSSPIFTPSTATKAPSKTRGVEIEMPDFDELFRRIQKVSPLARLAIERKEGGFAAVVDNGEYLL